MQLVAPDCEVLAVYAQLASNFHQKLVDTQHANQSLTNLRDSLLPKLMSGELRLPDAYDSFGLEEPDANRRE